MTKHILRVLTVTCLTLSLPSQSAAATIVDTGTPLVQLAVNTWAFGPSQYFAGGFTTTDSFVIQSIEGYFGATDFSGTGIGSGTVDIAIHADGGNNAPGAVLFLATMSLAVVDSLDWYGVFGLNQVLAPGTYWASFKPIGIGGIMPGTAPNPLTEYATGTGFPNFDYFWLPNAPNQRDNLALGVRINGDPVLAAPVPEPGTLTMLSLGLLLLRRRVR